LTNSAVYSRVLALDVGDSRIGIAVSDILRVAAHGLCVLERANPPENASNAPKDGKRPDARTNKSLSFKKPVKHKKRLKSDFERIKDIAVEQGAKEILLGLPYNLSGDDSVQTEKVREFAIDLGNYLRSNAYPCEILFYDERYTTKIAEDVLIEGGLRHSNQRKDIIDKQAAVVLLKDYLLNPSGAIRI